MRKYGESKATPLMMASVSHVTSGSELRKFQTDGFLLDRVYIAVINEFRFSFVRTCSTKGSFNWQKSTVLYSDIIGLLIRISVIPSFTNNISDDRIFIALCTRWHRYRQ